METPNRTLEELKRQNLIQSSIGVETPNRTLEELKLLLHISIRYSQQSPNRTLEELKLKITLFVNGRISTPNRTLEELKLFNKPFEHSVCHPSQSHLRGIETCIYKSVNVSPAALPIAP